MSISWTTSRARDVDRIEGVDAYAQLDGGKGGFREDRGDEWYARASAPSPVAALAIDVAGYWWHPPCPVEPPVTESDAPILQLLERYRAAVHAKDVDGFCALFADDLRVFDMWGRWSHDGLPAWRAMATAWFDSLGDERVLVEFDEVRTRVLGDMATAHAFVTFSAVSPTGETLRSLNNRLTWVLQHQSDRWQVIHEHTSAPVDNATGKPMFQR